MPRNPSQQVSQKDQYVHQQTFADRLTLWKIWSQSASMILQRLLTGALQLYRRLSLQQELLACLLLLHGWDRGRWHTTLWDWQWLLGLGLLLAELKEAFVGDQTLKASIQTWWLYSETLRLMVGCRYTLVFFCVPVQIGVADNVCWASWQAVAVAASVGVGFALGPLAVTYYATDRSCVPQPINRAKPPPPARHLFA
jgi:hypothetical protein